MFSLVFGWSVKCFAPSWHTGPSLIDSFWPNYPSFRIYKTDVLNCWHVCFTQKWLIVAAYVWRVFGQNAWKYSLNLSAISEWRRPAPFTWTGSTCNVKMSRIRTIKSEFCFFLYPIQSIGIDSKEFHDFLGFRTQNNAHTKVGLYDRASVIFLGVIWNTNMHDYT